MMSRMPWLEFLERISSDDVGRTAIGAEARYMLHVREVSLALQKPQKYRARLVRRGLSTTALDAVLEAWRAAGGKPRKIKRRKQPRRHSRG
jgi:hypothetical protein